MKEKLDTQKTFRTFSEHLLNIQFMFCVQTVLKLFDFSFRYFYSNKKLPVLKSKWIVRHVQKGHPTLVTQVNLILWNCKNLKYQWQSVKQVFSLHIPLWHITLFTVSYFLSEILRIPDNGRNRNLEIFHSFLSRNSQRYHHWIVKSTEKIFKEFCKGLPTMVGQRRKFWFLEPVKRLFHHSLNTSFWKR